MTDQYVGEIRLFAGAYAPKGWALCDGQLVQIRQNPALYALLGTNFGGDGKSTFALPDLRGRLPVGYGNGPFLTPRELGEEGGQEEVTLTTAQMPAHIHRTAAAEGAGEPAPVGQAWGTPSYGRQDVRAYATAAPNASMSPSAVSTTGGNNPHNNLSPYLVGTFIIALQGIYPQRP